MKKRQDFRLLAMGQSVPDANRSISETNRSRSLLRGEGKTGLKRVRKRTVIILREGPRCGKRRICQVYLRPLRCYGIGPHT